MVQMARHTTQLRSDPDTRQQVLTAPTPYQALSVLSQAIDVASSSEIQVAECRESRWCCRCTEDEP